MLERLRRNKKGSLQDIPVIVAIATVFAIVVLLGFKFMSELDTNLQSNDMVTDNAKAASTGLKGQYTGTVDNVFLFLVVGLALVSIVLAALVKVHPIFIPLFILGLLLLTFFTGVASNVYQEMAESTQLQGEADQLVFISNIMEFLPIIIFVFGILLMVVLHKVGDIV